MELLNKINKIKDIKDSYREVQMSFYEEFKQAFPFIMTKNMAELANKLESELHLLLCTALRHRSVKVQLKAKGRYSGSGDTIVNVQRGEPGFYYPQSQRGHSDVNYMDLENYINDNNDMFRKYEEVDYNNSKRKASKKDELIVELSGLKLQGQRIVPDKLDAYYKLLREVMAYRPRFLCYVSEGYQQNIGARFKVGGLEFSLQAKSGDVIIAGKESEDTRQYYGSSESGRFKYNPTGNDLVRLLDYSKPNSLDFSTTVHERLNILITNYDVIFDKLVIEEEKKKKAYETCESFLKQIAVHTLPFKVLKEITQK